MLRIAPARSRQHTSLRHTVQHGRAPAARWSALRHNAPHQQGRGPSAAYVKRGNTMCRYEKARPFLHLQQASQPRRDQAFGGYFSSISVIS